MGRSAFHRTMMRTVDVSTVLLLASGANLWHEAHAIASVPAPLAIRATTIPAPVPAPPPEERFGLPARIRIPRISVDAAVEQVALKPDGSMGVPKHPLNAGWYAPGPRPGQAGSAVIAGHVDWWRGARAVFEDLRRVRPGDAISVQDEQGKSATFVVSAVRTYAAGADATDVFVSADGAAHLNLITCGGAWDRRLRQYAERLVVFADRTVE